MTPSSMCMKQLIKAYNNDHCWHLTKIYKNYYVKNILSFHTYYLWSKAEPNEFNLGPDAYEEPLFEKGSGKEKP